MQTPKRLHKITMWLSALFSMLVVNGVIFAVASQLYGDLFVLLLLGLWVGFLFSIERMVRLFIRGESLAATAAAERARMPV
jgi:hypothetical protein